MKECYHLSLMLFFLDSLCFLFLQKLELLIVLYRLVLLLPVYFSVWGHSVKNQNKKSNNFIHLHLVCSTTFSDLNFNVVEIYVENLSKKFLPIISIVLNCIMLYRLSCILFGSLEFYIVFNCIVLVPTVMSYAIAVLYVLRCVAQEGILGILYMATLTWRIS